MDADAAVTVAGFYVNGVALPPPRTVQPVGQAAVRMVVRVAPPIDERSVVEIALSDGRRAPVRVVSIDSLGTPDQPLFGVLATVRT